MKIQLMSDLHLEVDPGFVPQPAPGADVLVLAGDIGALPGTTLAAHGAADAHLTRFSPQLGHWPVPVFYLPGNHEYDGADFDDTHSFLRALCADLGIVWLEGATHVLHGARFIGSTLWADFDALSDRPDGAPGAYAYNLRMRERAMRAADHFLEHARIRRHGRLFDAQAMRAESLACQTWLRAELERPFPGRTVVVTHFAPSLRSHDPRFGLVPATAGFCNALEALCVDVDLWLHGHLHCPSDYRIGHCRVVANPLGYAAPGEQAGFHPTLVVEL
jgi:predicted phosphodiesterase